ncbi:hypothetical protein B0H14DRAFT_2864694 [Mycena olivaceomarginata]|nr:hypothetical protein B0H14DRAFT_2864694 [Mycena olivaceomarginata]
MPLPFPFKALFLVPWPSRIVQFSLLLTSGCSRLYVALEWPFHSRTRTRCYGFYPIIQQSQGQPGYNCSALRM